QREAHGVRHGGDVRRLRRLVLRDAAGFHQSGILYVRGIRPGTGDRGARRHGFAARRRDRGRGDAGWLRAVPRILSIPDAGVRAGHGRHHGVAAARPDFDADPVGVSRTPQDSRRRRRPGGARMSAAPDAILGVEHLSMRFGGLLAVADLSFTARRGEITALIGPNGAGKTTVFNCITGFYRPSTGMMRLVHADGTTFLLERQLDFRISQRAKVARTFQNIRLFPGMTVLENLLVAQHLLLMKASGFTFLGLFGIPVYARAEGAAI